MERNFIPGSPWLFLKIYTGHKSGDELLVEYTKPMCERLVADGAIDKYFYIRYSDTAGFHLRVRLHIPRPADYGRVFEAINRTYAPCVDNGLAINLQCDTYRRELERYGEESMEDAEELFCIDSRAILSVIALCRELGIDDDLRWKTALLLTDDMLDAFGCTPEDKAAILEKSATNFKAEFGFVRGTFTQQLNDRFRAQRSTIEEIMTNRSLPADMLPVLDERKKSMEPVAVRLYDKMPRDADGHVANDRIMSYVHMTFNRLFRSRNRLYEMLIYEFLRRHYASTLARSKYDVR